MTQKIPPPPFIAKDDNGLNRWLLELTSIINATGETTLADDTTAVTQPFGDNSDNIATTAFVLQNAGSNTPSTTVPLPDATPGQVGTSAHFARGDHVHPTDTTRAGLASPTFTGTPKAPTPAINDSSPNIATTAFVLGQLSTILPVVDGTAAIGTSSLGARADHRHPTDTSRAGLASPAFTGVPTAPTAPNGTNTTQLATTAFVLANGGGGGSGASALTTFLAANVALGAATAFANVLSVTLAAGNYVIFGRVSVKDNVMSSPFAARFVNGATVLDTSGFVYTVGAGARAQCTCTVAITLAAPATITLQAADFGSANGVALANDLGAAVPMDTSLTWLKL